MENTSGNQAKFSSQYFGRTFINGIGGKSPLSWIDIGYISLGTLYATLELKTLSSITDEELKCLPLDKSFKGEYSIKAGEIIYGKKSILIEVKVKTENGCSYYYQELRAPQFDILRSKGIALPWMGLSVEKQIEYGWIKLKSQ